MGVVLVGSSMRIHLALARNQIAARRTEEYRDQLVHKKKSGFSYFSLTLDELFFSF